MIRLAVPSFVFVLAFAGCVGPPDVDAVNRPGPWKLSFTKLVDNEDNSIGHLPAPNYPDRIAHLPEANDACDPNCSCVYTPAILQVDDVDHVQADFSETCESANLTLRCLRDITFSTDAEGYGVCLEQSIGAMPQDSGTRYDLTLIRTD